MSNSSIVENIFPLFFLNQVTTMDQKGGEQWGEGLYKELQEQSFSNEYIF